MRAALWTGMLAAALAGAPAASETGEGAGLEASLNRFCEHVNHGDEQAAIAYFLPDATIVEDLPPYSWKGAAAGKEWLQAMNANAERSGMSGVNMRFLPAATVQITGDRGYAVIPGDLTYTFRNGTVQHARGYVTFSAQKVAADWRIQTLTWSWEQAER